MRAEMASEKKMDALSLSMYQKYLRIFFVFIYLLLQPYSCLPFSPAAHLLLPRRSLVCFFCSSPTRASPDSLLYNHAFFTMSPSQMYIVSYPTSNGLVACFYINKHNLKESPPRASMEHT